MIYGLQFVELHPVYRLHSTVGYFLEHGLQEAQFGPTCFQTWFYPIVQASPALREHFRAVFAEARSRPQSTRDSVTAVWKCHDEVQQLCDNSSAVVARYRFRRPQLVQALEELFRHLYDSTLESATFEAVVNSSVHDHYERFRLLDQRVCAFCGLNNYRDRGADVRASYDHYLPRSRYALGSVNFRNLIPMCDECNQPPNKATKDILYRDNGRKKRRRFYYPYAQPGGVRLRVTWARIPVVGETTQWKAHLQGLVACEKKLISAWDAVFNIRVRYARRIGEGDDTWVKEFLAVKNYRRKPSLKLLRGAFLRHANYLLKADQLRLCDAALARAALFRFLAIEAPDPTIEGYISRARSPAITQIPVGVK